MKRNIFKKFVVSVMAVTMIVGTGIATAYAEETKTSFSTTDNIALHNDFPQLRATLESLFGVTTTGNSKRGALYNVYGKGNLDLMGSSGDTGVEHSDGAWYRAVVQNPDFQKKLQDPAIVAKLKEIAGMSFSDVQSDHWASQYIPLLVYYDVINGVGGTENAQGIPEFRLNAGVKRSEFVAMFAKTLYGAKNVEEASTSSFSYMMITQKDSGAWYAKSWTKVNGMISAKQADKSDFNAEMSRMEVARAICETVFGDEYNDLLYGKKTLPNSFTDLKLYNITDAQVTEKYGNGLNALRATQKDNSLGVLPEYYHALNLLKSKGIMNGKGDNKVDPYAILSRAEIAVLMQNVTKVVGERLHN